MPKRWTLSSADPQSDDIEQSEPSPRLTPHQIQWKRLELAAEMLALVVESGLMERGLHQEVSALFTRVAHVRKQVRH